LEGMFYSVEGIEKKLDEIRGKLEGMFYFKLKTFYSVEGIK